MTHMAHRQMTDVPIHRCSHWFNRSYAHQMFLAVKQAEQRCYSTVGFRVAIQLHLSCKVPAELAVANAALTQSFFGIAAVQRKQCSCNLYATLVAALTSLKRCCVNVFRFVQPFIKSVWTLGLC